MPLSTCWQNPCVVAIVAASKSASAAATRARRRASSSAGHGGEQREHLVVGRRAGRRCAAAVQAGLDVDEALADPRSQLSGGHPPERHEQHALERRALGDVAGGEGGDRERLAGAGAGLEQGDARRQRAAHVERARCRHSPTRSSIASSSPHSRRA